MHPYLQTFITAMTPVGELRLAIPVALTSLNLTPIEAYLIAVLGNLIPIIFLLLFLDPVAQFLIRHSKWCERFFEWLFNRTHRRVIKHYEIYGYIALVIFVAIPLPITGAWTGSVAAYLLGIPFWKAFALIGLGVAISGLIVTLASLGIISLF
jgi:uncharacterized membrane protein